ncbi:ArsR family transcriptional regulator [Herbihabitans rhizosphaerae]|uniref:ArsR family transcriptional regulator n=1 Tax=Herbihabitans rhizosphaerae TaxID=1872711 RepID=A0A4Q7L4W9_9PSEU|nr:helix-turn-helix domain-containing protein [Herbihabitans rhizosphaerae]RZS44345.1 ArsR family transcriptional regulator [Herbihabitans rhizosphaerae]
MADEEFSEVKLSSAQFRTLAHPLRIRLLGTLRIDGPATATALAGKLDTNTGATSYHLRKLAEVGLVEETGEGRGRERWWRALHTSSTWRDSDVGTDPDDRAAAEWIANHALRYQVDHAERWLAVRHEWSQEWRDAASWSDFQLFLTPQRLRALNDELNAVIRRYFVEGPSTEDSAEKVLFYMNDFPLPKDTP